MLRALSLALAAVCAGAGASAAAPRGVILISVDALRADRIGARRDGKPLTPRLDRLASSGAWFRNAVAQAPWTLPSMATVFTGLPPHGHRLTNRFASFGADARELSRLPPSARTLAEAFESAGWETAAFTGDAGLDRAHGFDRGFDVYYDSTPFAGFETTIPLALEWLKKRGDRPFFLFVHGYDVHGQYILQDSDGTKEEFLGLRRTAIDGGPLDPGPRGRGFWTAHYDEQVARADERIGRFLDSAASLSTSTWVVVMSDHGDEFFEHGGIDHGMTLYDEVLRVALIVSGPGVPSRRIPEQARLLDLGQTLLDIAGVRDGPFLAQARGVSLRSFWEGRPPKLDSIGETDYLFHSSKRSIRTADGRKYILDLETLGREGYDLKKDPGETRNLVPGDARWAEALDKRLREALGFTRAAP